MFNEDEPILLISKEEALDILNKPEKAKLDITTLYYSHWLILVLMLPIIIFFALGILIVLVISSPIYLTELAIRKNVKGKGIDENTTTTN